MGYGNSRQNQNSQISVLTFLFMANSNEQSGELPAGPNVSYCKVRGCAPIGSPKSRRILGVASHIAFCLALEGPLFTCFIALRIGQSVRRCRTSSISDHDTPRLGDLITRRLGTYRGLSHARSMEILERACWQQRVHSRRGTNGQGRCLVHIKELRCMVL